MRFTLWMSQCLQPVSPLGFGHSYRAFVDAVPSRVQAERRHRPIYRELPTFNPQIRDAPIGYETHSKGRVDKDMTNSCYGNFHMTEDCDLTKKYPKSIITVPREPPTEIVHPTQKPIELCEWLINSYTNEGETVLDNTMGSGTTGIACVRTNRNFIGIEKDEKWFGVAQERIEKQRESGVQLRLFK